MAVLSKGVTFATNQQVTATALNNLADNATFASGAVDSTTTTLSGGAIAVKDGGISTAKLADDAVTEAKLANPTGTGAPVCATSPTLTTPAVTGLLDCSAASSGQIKFPAAQNASSDENTLDDYEEGTWTPSLGGTATYTTQTGRYTKIGRMVHISGVLTVNSIGTGSTGIISGLPFAAGANSAGSIGVFQSNSAQVSVYGYVTGSTFRVCGILAGGTGCDDPAVFFTNSTSITFSATYTV